MKKLMLAMWACVFVLFLAGSAMATPLLNFNVNTPTAGNISYAGDNAPLVGTGIDVDTVVGLETPLKDSVTLTLSHAVLNFTTGTPTGDWEWGGGTDTIISIVGAVPDLGITDDKTILLTGNFGSASVWFSAGTFRIAGASFFDTKHPAILQYYGLPSVLPSGEPFPYEGNFNISFNASGVSGEAFRSTLVYSGNITNTPAPVPEPATILFLSSGLIGLAGIGRRTFKKP